MYLPPATIGTISTAIASVAFIFSSYVIESNPQTQFGYSKFAFNKTSSSKLPSFYGMLVIYSPAAIASLLSLVFFTSSQYYHVRLLALFNTIHYLKRIAEVLFVHKYSGSTLLKDTCAIASAYTFYTLYLLYQAVHVPHSAVNQTQVILACVFFFVGEASNHYHHLILASLRSKKDDLGYKIPEGGLFQYVWCPHYLGEITAFLSMGLVSQHVLAILFQFTSAAYLSARALRTKVWYEQKFPDAPKRSALIPGVF